MNPPKLTPNTPPVIPPEQSLITYPSAFPIKVMGAQVQGFLEAVLAVTHQFDHRVGGQRAVELVELLAAGGCHRDGDAQVAAATAAAGLDRRWVKAGVELARHRQHRLQKPLDLRAHHLDRERAGVGDQGLLGWDDRRNDGRRIWRELERIHALPAPVQIDCTTLARW